MMELFATLAHSWVDVHLPDLMSIDVGRDGLRVPVHRIDVIGSVEIVRSVVVECVGRISRVIYPVSS